MAEPRRGWGVAVGNGQIADLSRRAARAAVDLAADEDSCADADADLHVDDVVDTASSAEPALAEYGQVHFVVDENAARKRALEHRREPDSFPAGELRRERDATVSRIDDAWSPDRDRLQARARNAGLIERSPRRRPRLRENDLRSRAPVGLSAFGADDAAVQIGDEREDLVRADVDAEDVAEVGTEGEDPGAGPGSSRSAIRGRLAHVPSLDEELDDLTHGGLREPGRPLEGRSRGRAVVPNGPEDERRVQPAHELR